jgi:hypothetical protein
MALSARDIPVTREQVYGWVKEAQKRKVNVEAYVRDQLTDLQIADEDVAIGGETFSLHQLILDDLDSYR